MHFKLLIAFIEDDKTAAVMQAAREEGATGATIVTQARGEGLEKSRTFFGLTLESQRDMLLFLVEEHLSRKILERICAGGGCEGDIETLEELSEVTMEASLCALGKSAPNPFLSTLRYFRDEYEAHVNENRCPAKSCKELISYYIDPDKCKACLICVGNCPSEGIIGAKNTIHVINQANCTSCGVCYEVCPSRFDAIVNISGQPVPPPNPEDQRTIVRKSVRKSQKQ